LAWKKDVRKVVKRDVSLAWKKDVRKVVKKAA